MNFGGCSDPNASFRLRLRVRLAKALTSEERTLRFSFLDREVEIESQEKDGPLSKAKWLVFKARGFGNEDTAKEFGEQLRAAVQIASLAARWGVDVGRDKATCWVDEEFARSSGFIEAHHRLIPNIHGLSIFPDDENTRIPLMSVEAVITADPAQFTGALEELGTRTGAVSAASVAGLRILNLALVDPQPLSQMVLAFSAIEAMGQNQDWSASQRTFLRRLASEAERDCTMQEAEREEVAAALRRSTHRLGLRQGVLRVLGRLRLTDLRKDWDRLYGIRSGLFHGTVKMEEAEVNQAALDAVTLCGSIVLKVLESEGALIPSVASSHFPLFALRDITEN
jgi:hypothetical protein